MTRTHSTNDQYEKDTISTTLHWKLKIGQHPPANIRLPQIVKQYTRHGCTFQCNIKNINVSIIIKTLRQKSQGENKIKKHFWCISLFTPTSSHLLNYVQWKTIIHLPTYIWPLKFYIRRVMCHWFNICMYVPYVGFTTTYVCNQYLSSVVSDLRQIDGLLRFPPPIKLTATI
jgi:hypothetical protein